jgi:hypothetical protein
MARPVCARVVTATEWEAVEPEFPLAEALGLRQCYHWRRVRREELDRSGMSKGWNGCLCKAKRELAWCAVCAGNVRDGIEESLE